MMAQRSMMESPVLSEVRVNTGRTTCAARLSSTDRLGSARPDRQTYDEPDGDANPKCSGDRLAGIMPDQILRLVVTLACPVRDHAVLLTGLIGKVAVLVAKPVAGDLRVVADGLRGLWRPRTILCS